MVAMIDSPEVRNVYHDQTHGVRYEVFAFRSLTRAELLFAVRTYLSQPNVKKTREGALVQIISIIGYDE